LIVWLGGVARISVDTQICESTSILSTLDSMLSAFTPCATYLICPFQVFGNVLTLTAKKSPRRKRIWKHILRTSSMFMLLCDLPMADPLFAYQHSWIKQHLFMWQRLHGSERVVTSSQVNRTPAQSEREA
jgi:hypothetical protein